MALIGFIGDISIDRKIEISLSLSKLLNECDYVIGNLEGPLIKKGRKKWKQYSACISNQFNLINDLRTKINLTHVNIFNNHIGDYGRVGIKDTIELLDKLGVKILKNIDQINNTKILNTGLLEYSGYFYNSELCNYGFRLQDLILKDKYEFSILPKEKIIINGHFGIEKINEISNTEILFFNSLLKLNAHLLIRHQPHIIQEPFRLKNKEIYSSIGDFCFANTLNNESKGLLVIYNDDNFTTTFFKIFCDGSRVDLLDKEVNKVKNNEPKKLSLETRKHLKERIEKEYRINSYLSLKRIIKNILRKEDTLFTTYQFSSDHIQPLIINELFKNEKL